MATMTESAILKVVDQSSAPIKRINAELKKLFATARSLKSTRIDLGVSSSKLAKASQDIKRLTADLARLKAASGAVRLSVNASGIAQARAQIAQLHAQAQRPVTVATRAAARPAGGRPAAGGFGALGHVGPVGVHVLGGVVGITAGSLAALAGHIGRAIKEGTSVADVGDYALDALQLQKKEKSAATAAIDELARTQPRPLLSRGMISQAIAETLPTAGYDVGAASWLVKKQAELIEAEVARGKSLDEARAQSAKHVKAFEQAGWLTDPATGKFDKAKATSYFDALKQIMPTIKRHVWRIRIPVRQVRASGQIPHDAANVSGRLVDRRGNGRQFCRCRAQSGDPAIGRAERPHRDAPQSGEARAGDHQA